MNGTEPTQELEYYRTLTVNLENSIERMQLFQQSITVINLCQSSHGVFSSLIEILHSLTPLAYYAIYKKENGKWILLKNISNSSLEVNDKILEWALNHNEPSIMPISDNKNRDNNVFGYIILPLRSPDNSSNCIVGWLKQKKEQISQHTTRLLSGLKSEAENLLARVRNSEDTREMAYYLNRVFDSFPQSVVSLSKDGIIKLFNKNAEYIFSSPAIVALGEHFTTVFSKDLALKISQLFGQVADDQLPRHIKIDGSFSKEFENTKFLLSISPIYSGSLQYDGVLLAFAMESIKEDP